MDLVKQAMCSKFTIKDLGHLKYFLKLDVARSKFRTSISETKFISDILNDIGMVGCKPASFPLLKGLKLSLESGNILFDPNSFRRLV